MSEPDRRVNVLLDDPTIKQRLKVYCALNGTNMKKVVAVALENFLKENSDKTKPNN